MHHFTLPLPTRPNGEGKLPPYTPPPWRFDPCAFGSACQSLRLWHSTVAHPSPARNPRSTTGRGMHSVYGETDEPAVLAVQCSPQTSPMTQLQVRYIHTAVTHASYTLHCTVQSPPTKKLPLTFEMQKKTPAMKHRKYH